MTAKEKWEILRTMDPSGGFVVSSEDFWRDGMAAANNKVSVTLSFAGYSVPIKSFVADYKPLVVSVHEPWLCCESQIHELWCMLDSQERFNSLELPSNLLEPL